jgi:HlyD family secretion protein
MQIHLQSLASSRPGRGVALLAFTAIGLAGCDGDTPDAYGNFESREVMISSEATGPLVRFELEEGDEVDVDAVVAQVDTVALGLQARELALQAQASRTRAEEARAQVRALEAQLQTNRTDLERTQRLFAQNAATAGDLNRMEGAVTSLTEQIDGARARVRLAEQDEAIVGSRLEQLRDRISRATVRNPVRGTVLTTMVEAGEFVQAGRTLYSVAPLDTLILRAYVSGGQLASLRVGGEVTVQFDGGRGELQSRVGRLTWVASEAEFTPTPIQTREERVDQVYAVKILVPNLDRSLKIGMPGELVLDGSGFEGAS